MNSDASLSHSDCKSSDMEEEPISNFKLIKKQTITLQFAPKCVEEYAD
eukprot:CAMPEP_0116871664 /NCGR_PEP_ID=MMETSP0463-20121206/2136_1 /TAXON_ID=181622 /ORGANISM="Strombidinopsis sp, Strain SopsisLIS2011" /LENGTH=47 /DNA_ID= /DNA_START= /DNA_END= /DNA_ORIENTATION=